MRATGFGVDIGTLFTTSLRGMRIGMSLSNFGTKMRLEGKDTLVKYDIDPVKTGNNDKINAHLDTDKWSMPLIFRAGVAMDFYEGPNRHTVALDALHPNNKTERLNVGAEYALGEFLFLRAVWNSLFLRDNEQGLSAGAGLKYRMPGRVYLNVDYAFADYGVLNNVHRFALSLSF
jgi:hypothetical protein